MVIWELYSKYGKCMIYKVNMVTVWYICGNCIVNMITVW